jgi:hypothetical protein
MAAVSARRSTRCRAKARPNRRRRCPGKPITLSTKPLSLLAPLDDEIDDEISEAVPA